MLCTERDAIAAQLQAEADDAEPDAALALAVQLMERHEQLAKAIAELEPELEAGAKALQERQEQLKRLERQEGQEGQEEPAVREALMAPAVLAVLAVQEAPQRRVAEAARQEAQEAAVQACHPAEAAQEHLLLRLQLGLRPQY